MAGVRADVVRPRRLGTRPTSAIQRLIEPYTVFFRADIEAMTIFHRTGKEPRWPDFFAEWKQKVARGEIQIVPFTPKPIPPFKPVTIPKQEVLQERD